MNKNRAALYERLSKEDVDKENEGDDSESIINQRLLLTDYALEHGFQVVDNYQDDDYSGLYNDRPEFERLLRDAKLGKFDVVIAKTQARFTRNMEHLEKYLYNEFQLLGIRFIGVVDNIDTAIKGTKKSSQISGLVNEWYSEELSENIRSVFKKKMALGQFLGGFACYGYLKDPSDKHMIIIDEEAAKVVQKIYQLFFQGFSIRSICHTLEDEGIPTPTAYKHMQGLKYKNVRAKSFSEKYNIWSETTVKRILTNETYIGTLTQGTCEKVSYKSRKVVALPREQWIVVKNHHEPIIDEELFNKVQSLRQSRRVIAENQIGDKKVHKLAGKIRCKDCGSTMIKSGSYKLKVYLRCQLANKTRNRECTNHTIVYSDLEKIILDNIQAWVNGTMEDSENKQKIASHLLNALSIEDRLKQNMRRKKELEDELESINKAIQLLYIDRTKEIITEEMFVETKNGFEKKIKNIRTEADKVSKEIESVHKEKESKSNLDELINKYCDYSELTNEMVADWIDYVEIGEKDKDKNQEVIIHWNI